MEELSKKERRAIEKENQRIKAQRDARNAQMRSVGIWGGVIALIVVAFWGLIQLGAPATDLPLLTTEGISETDHILGTPGAPVTLIEYSDFQCPACRAAAPVVKDLVDAYGEDIQFAYRHFPLTTIHPYAQPAAEAAEAAARQGKFYEFHDLLFENQGLWSNNQHREAFMSYAIELGLDISQFEADLSSPEVRAIVENNASSAMRSGVSGTPTFFLNGTQVQVNNYQQMELMIQNAIANAAEPVVLDDLLIKEEGDE